MNASLPLRPLGLALTALSVLALGLSAIGAAPVPFKGRANIVVTGQEFVTPTTLRLTGSATGLATCLGRFTRTETIVVDLTTGKFTGTEEFISADGARLTADIAGQFTSPDSSSAEGTYVFTGGTGRFRNATGRAAFEATADGAGFDVKFNGTVQF